MMPTKPDYALGPEPSVTRYEKILDAFAAESNGNAAIFSATAKQTRLGVSPLSVNEAEILSVSSGVAGPVLTSYVLWVLSRAIEMGLKRLYFISRDGEILLEIAKRLRPAYWPGESLELCYLWGSRHVWMLPSFVVSTQDLDRYLLQYYQNSSLRVLLGRVELTLPDCETLLLKYGFSTEDWERKLSRFDLGAISRLIADPDLRNLILLHAQERKDSVMAYLEQEGLFETVPYGLVDLGWAGVLKGALERILSLRGKTAPPFFFFGRIKYELHDEQTSLQAYQFNLAQGEGGDREWQGITWLMEMFCASLSGGLQRYEYRDGRHEPVLRPVSTELVRAWGFDLMRDTILNFAENLAGSAQRMKSPASLPPPASNALLKSFWSHPTRDEARVWGRFPV